MKRNLLYLASVLMFSVLSVNAQTKVWDFGNDATNWPTSPGTGTPIVYTTNYTNNVVIDNLGLFPGTSVTDFGIIDPNNASWTTPAVYTATKRFKFGSVSVGINPDATDGTAKFVPSDHFLYFSVNGPVTLTIWLRAGGTTARNFYVTDGSAIINNGKFVSDLTTSVKTLTASYTGGAGKLYLFGTGGGSFNIYKIEVTTGTLGTTATLGTNTFSKASDVTVYTQKNKVLFSNIKSKTNVAIYSLTGALVQSADVNEDSGLAVENGIYIVKLKSSEGEKTVKVIVQ